MNLHDISLRIENPSLLMSADIPVLHELTKKYPYSQLLSILYLKALSKYQALELEDEVGKHAYKITDRGRLFEILNEQSEVEIITEIFEETSKEETSKKEEYSLLDNENSEIEIQKIDSEIIVKHSNDLKNEPQKTSSNDEKYLDLEVISNAISGVFEKEFEPIRNEKETIQTSVQKEKHNETSENEQVKIKNKESKQRFSSWLRLGSTSEVKSEKSYKVDNIIDTFIQEDPKISQPKKEFYSPIKQAKKSLDSENIQYTETLANILGIQGNYPKAILAYEQLCLTIPEKKTFFVKKIKELKEKLNS